ncbi:MAG: fumarate hydratase [Candidatus Firestonebacteria bacterium]|nr:fumarate hydratase [Candidatus Firestonebacteria bacterium]
MRRIFAGKITKLISEMSIEVNYLVDKQVIKSLKSAKQMEKSQIAKKVLTYMLQNARTAFEKKIPLCQDTGISIIFMEIGQDVHITGDELNHAVNKGIREGYKKGYLRKSIVRNPLPSCRKNTGDNTPALLYTEIVPGDKIRIKLAAKGAGSENMSAIQMFKPTANWEDIEKFIIDTIKKAGANPCPPIIVGVGIGGSFEKCAILAKKAGLRNLGERNKDKKIALLEKNLLKKINELNIGILGFGGKTTCLSVNIETYPCHIASMPVAVNLNCYIYRHTEREI